MSAYMELIRQDACSLVARLQSGELSPHDLLNALEARISETDPLVNALPTLCFDRARKHADSLLQRPVEERGILCGMPVPIKDLTAVAGVRTTHGSPIFADDVPAGSDILVEMLERQGGVIYAKSNTPEFGAGANTFNEVFGATLNPWNLARSAAGSSGGAAAALATGMAWLAHGSDMGGSLRNPASFCSIVGMRPSLGRVATSVKHQVDQTLGAQGPMARNVADLALLLDAMCGEHPADPLSLPLPQKSFRAEAASGWRPKRIAYSRDLGITPVDPEVAAITKAAADKLADAGVAVEEAHPDWSDAHECFNVLRAVNFLTTKLDLLRTHRDKLKPEVVWNIEQGFSITPEQIVRAEKQRVAMMENALKFFETYDLLLTPATIVSPFPVEHRFVEEVGGHKFSNYIEWLAIAYAVTLACCPAISLPCGFTEEDLPVGLQIVGPPRSEGRLLAGAKFMEDLFGVRDAVPINPRPASST